MMQEWIIFALCLGVGGHIALGVVMHAPGLLETVPARSKISIEERTQRLVVN
jgi:hypothetical protein